MPGVLRLVDLFQEAEISPASGAAASEVGAEWIFADGAQWRAGPGAEGLEVLEGRLVGRAATDFPLVHLSRDLPRDGAGAGSDLLHAVEVRARVGGGANLELSFSDDVTPFEAVEARGRALPSDHRTPVVAGDELKTYVITPGVPVTEAKTRNLFVRPTDEAGASFEIESVRLIFRRHHLASIPSGIGWHGMSEIYRETVVSRSSETVTYRLTLPRRPRLDLAVGTLEERPVTFVAEVREAGESRTVLENTLIRPHQWKEVRVDLEDFAGREVELTLSLRSESQDALGFWGNPQIRDVGASGMARPPSVLLIIADTLRYDHLDLYRYGRSTAPALTRFARDGVVFDHCVAQATWTKVSVPSILTGLYPPSHGVLEFHDRLPATATTLAESFRRAGFSTLSMSSIRFTGKFTNLHQGFEVLHESGSLPSDARSKTSRHYVDRLLPWLESHRDVPFFALLHVADPHSPYRPYAPYDELWASQERAEAFEKDVERVVPEIENPLLRRFKMPTREELERAGVDPETYVTLERDWYDGSIRAMDAELERVFQKLDELGLEEKVLVAFVADHGTEFLDHGRHWHGHSVYGELARVPLVLKGPGIEPGMVREETVQTIDLMPTLLDLAGIEKPARVQGRSLASLLMARRPSRRPLPAFVFKAPLAGAVGPPPLGTESLAMVEEDYKLVAHTTAEGPVYELFDPGNDPLDLYDLSAALPEVIDRMSWELEAWRKKAEAERLPAEESLERLSSGELERLRSLGYIN